MPRTLRVCGCKATTAQTRTNPIIGTRPRKLACPLTSKALPSTNTHSHLNRPAMSAAPPTKNSKPIRDVDVGRPHRRESLGQHKDHGQGRCCCCTQRDQNVACRQVAIHAFDDLQNDDRETDDGKQLSRFCRFCDAHKIVKQDFTSGHEVHRSAARRAGQRDASLLRVTY